MPTGGSWCVLTGSGATIKSSVTIPSTPDSGIGEQALRPLITFAVVSGITSVALDIVQDLTGFAYGLVVLAAFGPAIGALAAFAFHRQTLAGLMPAAVTTRQVIAHLVLGVAASAAFFGLVVGMVALLGGAPLWQTDVAGFPFALVVVGLLAGALLQEIGWRGVLQPLIERMTSRLVATILVGAVWGFWVVQLLPIDNTFAAVTSVVVATVLLSILLGHFGNGSPLQRVLAATIVHWLVAVAFVLVAGYGTISTTAALALLMALAVTTIVFMAMFFAAQRKRARRA
jgi:membrane protease YdiL (CAAX protease family)